jgi:hypothetical protein
MNRPKPTPAKTSDKMPLFQMIEGISKIINKTNIIPTEKG